MQESPLKHFCGLGADGRSVYLNLGCLKGAALDGPEVESVLLVGV